MTVVLLVLLVLIFFVLTIQLIRRIQIIENLFLLRVPIFCGALLALYPYIARGPVKVLLGNTLVFAHWQSLAFISLMAVLTAGMVVQTVRLIQRNARERFGISPLFEAGGKLSYLHALLFLLPLALPVPIAAGYHSEDISLTMRIFGIIIGLFGGLVFASFTFPISKLIEKYDQRFLPMAWLESQPKGLTAGYLAAPGKGLRMGHTFAIASVIVLLVVYVLGFMIFNPATPKAPAMYFVLFLILLVGFVTTGVTFFVDAYRVPVISAFVFFSFVQFTLFDIDHYYQLENRASTAIVGENDHIPAMEQRFSNHTGEHKPVLVVVAASGGGIQAAGWTAQVLAGLWASDDFGPEFADSIGMISSVSGGSVGSLFFLDRYQRGQKPDEETVGLITDGAMGNSLPSSAWGMAYPDFLRFIGMGSIVPKHCDRGWALERSFEERMDNGNSTIENWRDRILKGDSPIPVFNSTIVENGNRYLLSPLKFKNALRAMTFEELYGDKGYTMRNASAARLSATFPYVTPIARAIQPPGEKELTSAYHVADGGYFDNFGIYTVVEWLNKEILPYKKDDLGGVIILTINAFPPVSSKKPSPINGWKAAAIGPLLVLDEVRGSTQNARNCTELSLLKSSFPGLPLKVFNLKFGLQTDPPLSWKLDQNQQEDIREAWEELEKGKVIKELKQTWDQLRTDPTLVKRDEKCKLE